MLTFKSEGHVASTKITDDTGSVVRSISDVKLFIKDDMWCAQVEVDPVRFDITPAVVEAVSKDPAAVHKGVTVVLTAEQVKELFEKHLMVLSNGRKVGV